MTTCAKCLTLPFLNPDPASDLSYVRRLCVVIMVIIIAKWKIAARKPMDQELTCQRVMPWIINGMHQLSTLHSDHIPIMAFRVSVLTK